MRRQIAAAFDGRVFLRSGERMSRRSILALCVLFAIVACCTDLALVDVSASGRRADSPGYWGFDTANLDNTCKPCDDFFQFAMGGWMKSNPVPPEYSTWGSFTVLADKNQQGLRQILEASAKADAPSGSNERKIGDFYSSCMDTAANASMSNVDLRDPIKTYHRMTVAVIQLITPSFSWDTYLRALGHGEVQELNVAQPNFFIALNGQLSSTPLEDWKTYFRWPVVDSAAPALPEKFVDEDFDFRGPILTGAKQIQPRWKRCVQS